ncbi:MAG: DUF4157 domain-containing protein [Myxococcales bacterium]|nr:DUF4157 domain-containing protein [Myxococcales bacterium]
MSENPKIDENDADAKQTEVEAMEMAIRRSGHRPLDEILTRKYLSLGRRSLGDPAPGRLDSATRERLRNTIGLDPSDVRIHVGEFAQEAADAMGARAFTIGANDIYFGKGYYNPRSPEGLSLLAHEVTHVYEDQLAAPIALSTVEDARNQNVREGEEAAAAAETHMFREAVNENNDGATSNGRDYYELTAAEKIILMEKVQRIMHERDRFRRDRVGK